MRQDWGPECSSGARRSSRAPASTVVVHASNQVSIDSFGNIVIAVDP